MLRFYALLYITTLHICFSVNVICKKTKVNLSEIYVNLPHTTECMSCWCVRLVHCFLLFRMLLAIGRGASYPQVVRDRESYSYVLNRVSSIKSTRSSVTACSGATVRGVLPNHPVLHPHRCRPAEEFTSRLSHRYHRLRLYIAVTRRAPLIIDTIIRTIHAPVHITYNSYWYC